MFVIFTFMFLYLYPFYMCMFYRSLILCVCLRVLMYVSVFAAVMANKVHHKLIDLRRTKARMV